MLFVVQIITIAVLLNVLPSNMKNYLLLVSIIQHVSAILVKQ
jgi:hypothetical protein